MKSYVKFATDFKYLTQLMLLEPIIVYFLV